MARDDNRYPSESGRTITRSSLERDEDFFPSDLAREHHEQIEGMDLDELASSELEADDEPQFFRASKRIPVRKSAVTRKTANRLRIVVLLGTIFCIAGASGLALYHYATTSWRFRIESGDNIETTGLHNVARLQVMDVLGSDIGRNIFRISLDDRKRQLEEIPWVESATVMRLLPDRLRISIRERTPVAFVRIRSKVGLIDSSGVVMELPRGQKYSFPVITGMSESDPLSTLAARMKIYSALVKDLDSGGAGYSKDLSEVELSDPDDVKVTVEDPAGALVIHLGSGSYLERYNIYMRHIREWRQQFTKLESVDLRFNGQIIVNADGRTSTNSVPAAPPQNVR